MQGKNWSEFVEMDGEILYLLEYPSETYPQAAEAGLCAESATFLCIMADIAHSSLAFLHHNKGVYLL